MFRKEVRNDFGLWFVYTREKKGYMVKTTASVLHLSVFVLYFICFSEKH